jgi:conjugal transfer ATP-binding protein TraC
MALPGMTTDPEIGDLDLKSLTHELAPWQVERDVLLLTDNSYVLGFECQPLETDGMSASELETLARRAKAWLHAVPEGEQVRLVHTVAPEGEQSGIIADHAVRTKNLTGVLAELRDRRLEALRTQGARGETLRTRLLVFVSYHPKRLRPPNRWGIAAVVAGMVGVLAGALAGWRVGAAVSFALAGAILYLMPRPLRKMAPRLRTHYDQDHRVLRGLRDTMQAHLQAMGLQPRALRGGDYLAASWQYANPRLAGAGVTPPPLPAQLYELTKDEREAAPWALPVSLRQLIVGGDVDRDFRYLRKDGRLISVLAMDTLPVGTTVMLQLLPLLQSRMPLTTVLDIQKPVTAAMIGKLTARASITANIQQSNLSDAAAMGVARQHEGLRQVLWRVFGGETQVLSLGVGVVLARPNEDELDRAALEIHRRAGEANGVTLVDETVALAPQWRRLMPGSGQANRRMRMALSENVVHLMPLSGPWRGAPGAEAVFRNRWGGLTSFDLFDERAPSWGGIVVGSSGSGKTAFVCQLLLQVLRPHVRAILIDKGANEPPSSFLTLTRALAGTELTFDLTGATSLNPFDLEPEQRAYFLGEGEDPKGHATRKLNFLITLVDHLVSPRGGPRLSEEEKGLVGEAILQTYLRTKDREGPVFLHDLAETLRNIGTIAEQQPSHDQQRAMESLATRLFNWVGRGRYAPLLDRPTTAKLDAQVTYIDIGPITGNPDLMAVIVLLLQDLVYRSAMRQVGVERTIVVQDELWSVLADRTAAEFINDLYRRFRQVNAAVLSISQDFQDFRSEEARAILNNAPFWFLFSSGDTASTIEQARLNERQARLLGSLQARAGEHAEMLALIRFGDHNESGVLRITPTPEEFWISASHAHEKLLRQKYVQEAGTVWAGIQRLARDHPRGTATERGNRP